MFLTSRWAGVAQVHWCRCDLVNPPHKASPEAFQCRPKNESGARKCTERHPLARLPTRVSTCINHINHISALLPLSSWFHCCIHLNPNCRHISTVLERLMSDYCWLLAGDTRKCSKGVCVYIYKFKSLLSHWNKMKKDGVFVAKLWSSTIAKRDALSIVECTIKHHPTRTAGSHCYPAGPCGPCVDKNPLHRPVLGTRKRRFLIGSPAVWGNYPAPCDATRCCRGERQNSVGNSKA